MSIIIAVLAAAIVTLLIVILTEVLRIHDHMADAEDQLTAHTIRARTEYFVLTLALRRAGIEVPEIREEHMPLRETDVEE